LIFKDSASFIQSIKDQPFKLAYMKAVSRNIVSRVETVLNQWQGAYGTAFINNDGAQAGSSISDLYNSFVFHFEVMKNYNLGLPMGKRAGQVNSEPSKVEGYYSGFSTALLKAKYTALRHLWFGYARLSLVTSLSANGFKEYILSVENGPRLAQDTELQWNVIGTGISTIDAKVPLHTMIIGQSSQLEQIFLEMTKHTRFIKSEMSSLLGISITYASGDGD
jgi:predicted lipoprotein